MTNPPSGPPSGPPATAYNFNPARLSRNDWIAGGASLILLISLFLPWFRATINGSSISGTESGTSAHGWLWLVFILVLGVLALLALLAGLDRLPFSAPTAPQILTAATGLNALLILIAFLAKPSAGAFASQVSVSWSIGAFLGLIAAIVAVVFAVLSVLPATSGKSPTG